MPTVFDTDNDCATTREFAECEQRLPRACTGQRRDYDHSRRPARRVGDGLSGGSVTGEQVELTNDGFARLWIGNDARAQAMMTSECGARRFR